MGQIELSGTVKFGACQLPVEVTGTTQIMYTSRCNLLVEVSVLSLFVTEFEKNSLTTFKE